MPNSKYIPGLVSVTFRGLSPTRIVELAAGAGLQAIEWGGDVHVPPGGLSHAADVARLTRDYGMGVACYGSYYRVGSSGDGEFESVLDTAMAMGAPLIRVWAGSAGSADTTPDQLRAITEDLRRIGSLAAGGGVSVATEFHGGTYCDTAATTRSLMEAVGSSNVKTLWQPNGDSNIDCHRADIEPLSPWLSNVHVFHWNLPDRLGLIEGESEWSAYFAEFDRIDRPIGLLLEFVRDDSPEQLFADAKTLIRWIS